MRIAILGAGQLGGSLAWAFKKADSSIHLTAYDISPEHARYLLKAGAIDAVAATPAEAVGQADIIILASPLRSYPALAKAIAHALKPDAIVTDVGSVKASMQGLSDILPAARLVPGHPIAGTEKAGPEVAQSDLFRGRLCLLTPAADTDESSVAAIETLWHLAGADILRMPVEVHDQVYAYVSHLPHYIAFLTAQYLHRSGARMGKDDVKLQQFLRISRSNARMWTDVGLENRDALLNAMTTYTAVLEHFVIELKSGAPGEAGDRATLAATLLPRILASSLISTVTIYEQQANLSLKPFAGAGMRDISSPALVPPDADIATISSHAGTIAALLNDMLVEFRRIEALIGVEDEPGLFAALTAMAADAHALAADKN